MFSFSHGRKIARIEGGKYNGKILYIQDPLIEENEQKFVKCCNKCGPNCRGKRNGKYKNCCSNCKRITGGCQDCGRGSGSGKKDIINPDNQEKIINTAINELITNIDPMEILNDQYFRNQKKKITVMEMSKIRRAIMNNIQPIEEELVRICDELRSDLLTKCKYELILYDGKIIPLPNEEPLEPDHIYVAAPTGAGKSSWIGKYINEIKKMNNSDLFKDIFLFSIADEDSALDYLNPGRIEISTDLIKKPMRKEELKNSIVVFDDIDTLKPKPLADAVRLIRDDLLQNGRKDYIRCICSSHQLMNYRLTRDLLNSSQKVVFFPSATSPMHIKRFLKEYVGVPESAFEIIKNFNSRWIMVHKNHPSYLLHENGAIILNRFQDLIDIKHKEKYNRNKNSLKR